MILKIFLFWRLGLLSLTFIGSQIFPLVANGGIGAVGANQDFNFWASWAQWDGGHFYNIAKFGYFAPNEYAFFPLFPILIKFTSFLLFDNILLAGFLITNIAFLIFLYVFYELIKTKYDQKIARSSLITLITFPTTYFAVAYYSESLFLLFIALTFLLLEKRKFLQAAIFVSLASLTRTLGIFLVIPQIISCLQDIKFNLRNINAKALSIPVALVGFGAYSTYLHLKFNDPFYFLTVQSTWNRTILNPLTTVYSYLTQNLGSKAFNDFLDVFLTITFVIILAAGRKQIPFSWWLFALLAILIPVSTGTLTSMPRYLLASLPVFILIGDYLTKATRLKFIIWSGSLILQIALAIMFVNGHWTA